MDLFRLQTLGLCCDGHPIDQAWSLGCHPTYNIVSSSPYRFVGINLSSLSLSLSLS
ncbi:hypothetical protein ACN38_g7239, partial [Penicillium nordicum]